MDFTIGELNIILQGLGRMSDNDEKMYGENLINLRDKLNEELRIKSRSL